MLATCCDNDNLCFGDGTDDWCCDDKFYCSTNNEKYAIEKNGILCPVDLGRKGEYITNVTGIIISIVLTLLGLSYLAYIVQKEPKR